MNTGNLGAVLQTTDTGLRWSPTHYKISEFMKIEDDEIKRYVFAVASVNPETVERKVETDEKIGYYLFLNTVKINTQGKFYVNSQISQWVYYNKKTKKAKLSINHTVVVDNLLKDHFNDIQVVKLFIKKMTPTLCKKIIEGKISTFRDIVKYNISYSIKRKELDHSLVFKYLITKHDFFLRYIEDPENIDVMNFPTLSTEIIGVSVFRFKVKDIPNLKTNHDEWLDTQNKRFNSLIRQRDGENGDNDGKEPANETSFSSY